MRRRAGWLPALLPAALLFAALLPACQSTGGYWSNRAADFGDMLRGHIIAGKAVAVEAEVTRYLSLGFTWEDDAWSAGLHNRAFGTWHETVQSLGLVFGRHDEMRVVGIPRVSGTYGWTFKGTPSSFHEADPHNPVDWLTLRATLAVIVGIDLEVRVGEMVDFVAGFFGWDPAKDDKGH